MAQWYIQGMKLCLTVHTHAHTQKKGPVEHNEPNRKKNVKEGVTPK